MKLSGWQKRLDEHQAKIDRLEASGEMTEIHKYSPKKFAKLYKRLGYLKQKVASLSKRAVWTEIEEGLGTLYVYTPEGDIYRLLNKFDGMSIIIPENLIDYALSEWNYQDYPVEKIYIEKE